MLALVGSVGTLHAQSTACESMVELCGKLDTLVSMDALLDLDGAEVMQDTLYLAEIQVLDVQDDGDTLSTFSEIEGTAATLDSLIALTVELVEANDERDSVSVNRTPIPTAPFVASNVKVLQVHTTLFGQFADAQEPLTAHSKARAAKESCWPSCTSQTHSVCATQRSTRRPQSC